MELPGGTELGGCVAMKYCPSCGAEYRPGFAECADCGVPLIDEPPPSPPAPVNPTPTSRRRAVVFRSGRRMDAELVRATLEADGLEAAIWSGGLGPWRLESALTEVTGIATDFNSHQVVVDEADVERALEVLAAEAERSDDAEQDLGFEGRTGLESLRDRRLVVPLMGFLLIAFAGGYLVFALVMAIRWLFS